MSLQFHEFPNSLNRTLGRCAVFLSSISHTRWLALMLLSLHVAVAFEAGPEWVRAFLMAHYGFFLLWQPLLQGQQKLETRLAIPVLGMAALLVLVPSGWMIALWVAVLAGLTGAVAAGMPGRGQRWIYLLALAYLLTLLLLWIMPKVLSDHTLPVLLRQLVQWGLPVLPALILVSRGRMPAAMANAMDFFYGLMVFLMVVVLALGTFAVVAVTKSGYAISLVQTLTGMAVLLLALSWLWNPRAGFSGLGGVMSRYLLSVGLPFEEWARGLATRAERERDPETFVRDALADTSSLAWISGGTWTTARGSGEYGKRTEYVSLHAFHGLTLEWFSERPLTPALSLHVRLLSQLLGYFYASKVREQTLRDQAYTQAIHETGARLTHDVKNILQSMKTLMTAAETSGPEDAERLQALLVRQIPQLAQRLQNTVDKLKQPHEVDRNTIAATIWYAGLLSRYAHDPVRFAPIEEACDVGLPQDLFDSVADNLLTNALRKRKHDEQPVVVKAGLTCGGHTRFFVEDDGAPVPEHVARNLFFGPVSSEMGLGVGLYQAARQAGEFGYELSLAVNQPGCVRFELTYPSG
jgi:signal transduction histidine kinase